MNEITDKQWRELAKLGKNIIICLRQNLNGDGVPPRSDRFEALKLMQKYLAIHGIPNQDRNWDLIESLEWGEDYDHERIKSFLKDKPYRNLLSSFAYAKQSELKDKFHNSWLNNDKCGGIEVSDDGWEDLTAHIVGLGKWEYENIDIQTLQEMAFDCSYKENFLYSFQD